MKSSPPRRLLVCCWWWWWWSLLLSLWRQSVMVVGPTAGAALSTTRTSTTRSRAARGTRREIRTSTTKTLCMLSGADKFMSSSDLALATGATNLFSEDPGGGLLAFWIAAFASTHIGLSAARVEIIGRLGRFADGLGLVGNADWKLPRGWPGENGSGSGGEQDLVFPDTETAGRQLYRAGYTAISFLTLGNALLSYLDLASVTTTTSIGSSGGVLTSGHQAFDSPFAWIAVAANAASLTSLANASPLGLVPGFEATSSSDGEGEPGAALGIRRDDGVKFRVRGLTRITRHPLILPVVPWGISNAIVLGGRPADWLLFGGLAIYAVLGCAAQDLRVLRREGSVGTVFLLRDDADSQENALREFYEATSFVPFAAVLDGRQSFGDVVREIPWPAALVALPVGYGIEAKMLEWLASSATASG